jgi:hypothetical protein
MVAISCGLAFGLGLARAEQAATGKPAASQPPMDPAMQAAMETAQRLGSPGEPHQALEPFAGTWSYTAQWWMSPDEAPRSMTGVANNALIFGGRFLRQEISGQPMEEGQPPFEGVGFIGYDNIRKEYQSVWLDNMMTGMMRGTGAFDAASRTLADQGDFSCPMTGEANRWYRTAWTVVDEHHTTYESYARTPDGREFKSMVIQFSRAR